MVYAKCPSLLTVAELCIEDASLVTKPEVFESLEDSIAYMTKLYVPGLLD